MKKKLIIPNLPALDVLDLSSVGFFLENKALRLYINTVNWQAYPYRPIAVVDVARTDRNLYLRYFVRGYSLKALYDIDGSPVHKDSCVEFFVKTPDSLYNYINFEFNCIGTCDAAYRQSREEKEEFTLGEYASIKRHTSLGVKTMKEETGIHSWELIVSIPFELLDINPENLPKKIAANFYKCADDTQHPHFLSWAPIDLPSPDFHCPAFFSELYL